MPSSTAAAAESVFSRLEPLLPTVSKPIQYVGGELNSTHKEWDSADGGATVRWALMYPDAYEVGLPNQGVQILYEVLNERDWILAERTYSVWPDMEKVMREHGIPQFTVDEHRPVRDFDVFGISFSTELGYTNMLTALDLAGIPLHAVDRGEDDPVVLAGGHAADACDDRARVGAGPVGRRGSPGFMAESGTALGYTSDRRRSCRAGVRHIYRRRVTRQPHQLPPPPRLRARAGAHRPWRHRRLPRAGHPPPRAHAALPVSRGRLAGW